MTTESESWLRKPKVEATVRENPFDRYGFSRNPFPSRPSLVIGSDDLPYEPSLRAQEDQQFERLMIPAPGRTGARTVAFLMDYATRRGRGIGKTAFLNHQRERIMRDLGDELTNGSQVLFACHILPEPGQTRKFWQFARQIAEHLNEQGIIAWAMWRLRAFSGLIPQDVLAEAAPNPEQTIGNNNWLRERKVEVEFTLGREITNQLKKAGLRPEIAPILARFGHSSTELRNNFLASLTDFRWRQEGKVLVFDDFVHLFTLAGFSGGLLLVDEVEKIVSEQNIRERRTFVDLIRYCFVDGRCENARRAFYRLFLTIHPYLQELLAPHWEAAGLDRFAALSRELAQNYTVYFRPLKKESAEPLVMVYLDECRLEDGRKGFLSPFTKTALEEALFQSGGVPGRMLTLLHHVMEKAVDEEWDSISESQILQVSQVYPPEEPEDAASGARRLPSPEADLRADG